MIVIADDITGAAEMAGMAFVRGEEVRLVCGCSACNSATATDPITVIATDTRSMSEAEAVAEIRHIAKSCLHSSIFKKVDSALRGHVVVELTALIEATGYQRAVYLPANPSKGRIIRGGSYYINGKPLHETDFSFDPEFPAKTSVLRERFPDAETKGIIMPDAESLDDIKRIVAQYDDGKTLFAGAADLFSALLANHVDRPQTNHGDRPHDLRYATITGVSPHDSLHDLLILCGSTQSKPVDLGIPVILMPREVYDGEQGVDYWLNQLPSSLNPQPSTLNLQPSSLILSIPYTHRTGKEVAVHLRTVMAEMTKHLISIHRPEHLIIEGGATAWATLTALGWTEFEIVRQYAPGVVQMRAANGILVTLKPGSYPWGPLFS